MQALIFALALSVIAPGLPGTGFHDDLDRPHGTDTLLSRIEDEVEWARDQGAFERPAPSPEAPPEPEVPAVLEFDTGEATFYGGRFDGRRTASGERFDQTP